MFNRLGGLALFFHLSLLLMTYLFPFRFPTSWSLTLQFGLRVAVGWQCITCLFTLPAAVGCPWEGLRSFALLLGGLCWVWRVLPGLRFGCALVLVGASFPASPFALCTLGSLCSGEAGFLLNEHAASVTVGEGTPCCSSCSALVAGWLSFCCLLFLVLLLWFWAC